MDCLASNILTLVGGLLGGGFIAALFASYLPSSSERKQKRVKRWEKRLFEIKSELKGLDQKRKADNFSTPREKKKVDDAYSRKHKVRHKLEQRIEES